MLTRTLTNLTADVRLYSGLGTGQFLTDAQIRRLLNESIRSFAQLLTAIPGAHYTQVVETLSLAAGSSAVVDFPTDCFRIDRLTWVDGVNEYPIKQANIDEQNYDDTTSQTWSDGIPSFTLMVNAIRFYPVPSATMSIKCYYQSYMVGCYDDDGFAIEELTTGNDYYDCKLGFENWVVYHTSIKVKTLQDESTTQLEKLKAEEELRIRDLIASRVNEIPKRLPQSKYIGGSGSDYSNYRRWGY